MKINKQMLLWTFILLYVPIVLYSIMKIFINSALLFIPFVIYMIALSILSKVLSKNNSKMKFIYNDVISSKNDPMNRGSIIKWIYILIACLILFIFIFFDFLDDEPGRTIFYLLLFGYIFFMNCITFNFENKKG
ncbi:hypothetical protein DY124_06675 [Apilactobacillus micheneri]|uniref:hypothetical protein n=1 Tax=Apilactobacillus micheneri TaxID=1899430 RepID=UPI001127023F|nr:hypothetical protein [Apilactobacillus micheneri]TPR42958.1 hypothetical protein DY124_06675 [Apilactobacillus micheneri]TPR47289.1 hypothetical protein DY125_06355 [Apilactobacillus micheneri]